MKAIFTILASAAIAPAMAQFDYGLAIGGMGISLWPKHNDDPHGSVHIWNAGSTAFSAAAFYRERYSGFVDLGLDLSLAHRSFSVNYGTSGLGGGTTKTARVEMDQVYIGVKPEVRMDAKRLAVVRFGLMAGFRAGSQIQGSVSTWDITGPGPTMNNVDLSRDFGGDIRFAFGFGFRFPAGERWAVTVDPEGTFALSSMLHSGAGIRGSDICLRIGCSRRSNKRAVTELFKVPPGEP